MEYISFSKRIVPSLCIVFYGTALYGSKKVFLPVLMGDTPSMKVLMNTNVKFFDRERANSTKNVIGIGGIPLCVVI
tara:strand:+ start:308 stop:535 length:228 start_codon:yes stop_codon:yes gene_type:complete